ncbi:sucrase ferredoxin [Streptomyces sp. CRN 30]|uniref:sucrase ferredoxin n=1 Tax=Streptomyces sp. CRN 30 TaxID=3075613 RepID=UPI002A835BF9|nr:sucrase ferredoxin [Streptomyces sp. CRN 30]
MSRCSTVSQDLAEPVSGTAATARTWLLLEQPGPWGATALTSSLLDPAVGRALDRATRGTDVRVALIRRPGRQADRDTSAGRRVFVAHGVPGRTWLRTATVTDPARLLGLDFTALGRGDHRGFDNLLGGRAHTGDPLVLVCTNGKRDQCCALLGRPLAAELAGAGTEGVWEVTHLGGHRFSPTLLVLPYGYVYGRVDARTVRRVLRGVRQRRIVLTGCRGSSAWERPGQAAELAVRAATGEDAAEAFGVVRTDGSAPRWEVTVAHIDGRHWRVEVSHGAPGPARPESCGASVLGSPARLEVTAIRELTVAALAG